MAHNAGGALQQGIDALAAGSGPGAVRRAAFLLLGAAALGAVARFGMRQLLNSGSRKVETDLRAGLFRHLERLTADFYDRYTVGDIMARSTNDLLAVRMVAGPALMYLVDTVARALSRNRFSSSVSLWVSVVDIVGGAFLGRPGRSVQRSIAR